MSESIEIHLDRVNEWLNDETTSIINPLREEAKKIIEDNQEKLEELSEACDKLLDDAEKEMEKNSRKTYRRAKFLYKLAGTFSDLLNQIKFPKEINGKSLNETCNQMEKTLKTISQDKTKWFRIISPYFILSRRRFEVSFKRTEDSFRTLNNFLMEDYVKAENAEGIPSKIEDLTQFLKELKNSEKAKELRAQKKERIETMITKTQQKLEKFQNREEVVELSQINTRIEELTKKIKHELRHIQKPLLKFQTLVNNPGYSILPEEKAKLEEYLENPFKALATEKSGYPIFSSILEKIDIALDNKKMKLKSSRLRKAKDQINRIVNKTTLITFQLNSSEAIKKKIELLKSEAINEARNQKVELSNQLKELQRRKKILETRDLRLEKERQEKEKRVEEQKKSLEQLISKISRKKILLLTN